MIDKTSDDQPKKRTVHVSDSTMDRLKDLNPDLTTKDAMIANAIDLCLNQNEKFTMYENLINHLIANNIDCDMALNKIKKSDKQKQPKSGINKERYARYKQLLIDYNNNPDNQDRKVYITLKLFLDLTKGNVNTVSKLFKEDTAEFDAINSEHGLDTKTNRALSIKIGKETDYNTVSDYLLSIFDGDTDNDTDND